MVEIPKGQVPGYRIEKDRGDQGVFDKKDDVVNTTTNKEVDWREPGFQTARNEWVRKNYLEPAVDGLARVRETLAPAVKTATDLVEANPDNKEAAKALMRSKLPEVQPAIETLIERLQEVVDDKDSLPILKSDAQLLIAGLAGQIVKCDPSGSTGKAAMTPLREALESNPNNTTGWASYGVAMVNTHLGCPTGIKRGFAETYLFGMFSGTSIKGELNRVIKNLARFPDDVPCQVILDQALTTLANDPQGEFTLSSKQMALKATVSQRLAQWANDPEKAALIDKARKDFTFMSPKIDMEEPPS